MQNTMGSNLAFQQQLRQSPEMRSARDTLYSPDREHAAVALNFFNNDDNDDYYVQESNKKKTRLTFNFSPEGGSLLF